MAATDGALRPRLRAELLDRRLDDLRAATYLVSPAVSHAESAF